MLLTQRRNLRRGFDTDDAGSTLGRRPSPAVRITSLAQHDTDAPITIAIQMWTAEPNLQSHALSRTYSAILPTSLTYIVLSARGCSPWRPAAVMSTTRCETNIFPLDFQGSLVTSRTPQKAGCFSSCQALSPDDPIPRLSKSVKKKRELFPGLRVTSRGSLALPHLRNISYC